MRCHLCQQAPQSTAALKILEIQVYLAERKFNPSESDKTLIIAFLKTNTRK